MPAKDRKKRSEAWYRWYVKNRHKHYVSVKKHANKRISQLKAEVNTHKVTRGCLHCGYNAHPEALDFDHRPGEKKCFNVSTAIRRGVGRQRLLDEIAKCDVACANCHRVHTCQRRVPGSSGLGCQPVTLESRVRFPVAPPNL